MAPESSGLSIGSGANIGNLTVGDVAGRDLIKITEEQSYDVSGLRPVCWCSLSTTRSGTRST